MPFMKPHHVEMRAYRFVGWCGLILFSAAAVAAFRANERGPAIGLGLFALFGLYIILAAGSFDFDGERIVHRSAFGEWQIRWDEIVRVEMGAGGGTLVLKGDGKVFVLSPPGWWSGTSRSAAFDFLMSQLEKRNLQVAATATGDYAIMRNTRVRRPN